VNSGAARIQCIYSSAYSILNIRLNVSALLLEISRQFNARYTANLVPNTAHILRFTQCELWSRSYTMNLQLHIFRIQYSFERICAAIVHITTIQCVLYCKLVAKYSAHPTAYAMCTVVTGISKVLTVPHIKALIFNRTYLRCCWRYAYICMRVILQILCQIQSPTSGLRYVKCGPGQIKCIYSSIYSDFNIHLNVSALLLYIARQFNARYTANLLPNTAHILRFTLCELWSRAYTMNLQLHIFRLQYSFERICAAIVHITTIQCVLYCKLVAKYSAHPTVYAMCTVVTAISKVPTAPHIKALIFNCRQLPCYWRYLDNSMLVILHSWCQIQRTSSSLRYVTCGPGHIQSILNTAYLGFNIQLKVAPQLL
jgi:hypothetical protein